MQTILVNYKMQQLALFVHCEYAIVWTIVCHSIFMFYVFQKKDVGDSAFIKPGQLLHCVMHKDGLYYHDTRNREITLVQTVQENEEGYIQRQIQDAKKSQDLYAKVGYPSARDL